MYKFLGIQSRKDTSNEYQPKGDYVTLSQFNTYTKDTDTTFNNIGEGLNTVEDFMRKTKTDISSLNNDMTTLKTELKPAFNELNGRMEKYLAKEDFESFRKKLMTNNPSINAAFTYVVTKSPSPATYLRTRNYMYY